MAHKNHVAGVVCDDGISMSGCIVNELVYLCHCVFGSIGLLSGYGAKVWDHGCINGSSLIKESDSDFLNKFLSSLLRRGLVLMSSMYCAFAPYVSFMRRCGWSCGLQGCLW